MEFTDRSAVPLVSLSKSSSYNIAVIQNTVKFLPKMLCYESLDKLHLCGFKDMFILIAFFLYKFNIFALLFQLTSSDNCCVF